MLDGHETPVPDPDPGVHRPEPPFAQDLSHAVSALETELQMLLLLLLLW